MRYELPTRGRSLEDGLAARIHDPLWLLARQWQFGEYRHENVGSPAWVAVRSEHHQIDQWRRGEGADWHPYDVAAEPLERMVEEHEGGPTPRLRLDGGVRWAQAVGPTNLGAFVVLCGFPKADLIDDLDRRLRRALPDGAALVGTLRRLADPATSQAELIALRAAAQITVTSAELAELASAWLAWWDRQVPRRIGTDEDCWDEHRMEHSVALRASSLPAVELRAEAYTGGRLDWSSFDAVTVPTDQDATPLVCQQSAIPAPARFGGMPTPRFWEMEDARFDPGAVDAGPVDLGRLMLIGYATVYGNDWFALPVRLPVGSLNRVTECTVHDVFDQTRTLPELAADVDGWHLFGHTSLDVELSPGQERATSGWLLQTPCLPAVLEGPATDIVMLMRDEMANLSWAVEAVAADGHGRPRDRFEVWAAREQDEPALADYPRYVVATEVPDHWFPLAPEQLADLESIRLRLVPLSRLVEGEPVAQMPIGTLLPQGDAWLYEEEVPRAGIQVVRGWRVATWHDGRRHVWQSRRKLTGRGEGASGLRFDQVINSNQE